MRNQEGITADAADRLVSLDVFRGITIAGMILVNTPGSWRDAYPPLRHAQWHGWTPTDLIFPFFLFIVGVAISFSLAKLREKGGSPRAAYLKVLRRCLILFLLGIIVDDFPNYNPASLRIPGVLQRIALVYFAVSFISLHCSVKAQKGILGSLLFLYWGLLKLVSVPGYGPGDLSIEGNFAAYLDNLLLPGHLYRKNWDPEGIVSTLPAIATGVCGALVGEWLRSVRNRVEVPARMFVIGWISILAGLFWGIWFPINKNLWTSSYVLFTSGAALQFLGFCYWMIEVRNMRRWAFPAVVFGMNSIAAYVISRLLYELWAVIPAGRSDGRPVSLAQWIYQHLFQPWANPLNASLAFALCYVILIWAIMYIFYRRRVFLKI